MKKLLLTLLMVMTTTDTMAAETSMVRGHTDNRDPWADP